MEKLAALGRIPMFERVSKDVLEPLLDYFIVKTYARGQLLWCEGAPAQKFTFIASGQIKVSKIRRDGGETILGIFDDGDAAGQIAVFKRINYPATATALRDTVCLEIYRSHFFATLRKDSSLLESLIQGMMSRNHHLVRRVEELTTSSAEQRLAMLFSKFCEKVGQRTKSECGEIAIMIPLPLTRKDIADLINVRVETAIRMMSKWNKYGPVKTVGDGFIITNMAALKELSGETFS